MLRTRLLRSLAVCLPLLLSTVLAAPGDLDASFGTGGKVITVLGDKNHEVGSVGVQADGRIVVAGRVFPDLALVRYETDGSLDTSFGGGTGRAAIPFASGSRASSVVVQADGMILVAGGATVGLDDDFGLARYTSAGELDPSFGGGTGKVTTAFGASSESVGGVAVQADGKIVAVGGTFNGNNADFALARYTSAGVLDTSFGGGTGKVTTAFGSFNAGGQSVAVQADGAIVVAGGAFDGNSFDFALVRYTSAGALDPSFGGGTGRVTTSIGSESAYCTDMLVQADGKIVAAGYAHNGSDYDFVLVRYLSTGARDTSFGDGNGIVMTDFGSSDDQGQSVAIQSDGSFIVAGYARASGGDAVFALARYTSDGKLDASFGDGTGKVKTAIGLNDECQGVTVQADGRIVAAGRSYTGVVPDGFTHHFALVRYLNPSPLPPPVFDTATVRADGAAFVLFGAPTVDSGVVGGVANVRTGRQKQTIIYGGADGEAQARTGEPDAEGATFTVLGDPVLAGEGIGFAGMARLAPATSPLLRIGFDARMLTVRPGGRVAALYSQLSAIAGVRRLAAQADPAPGGGQFARFGGFGLPRSRAGMVFAAKLHRSDGVMAGTDSGIWREKSDGSGTDKLLRTGDPAGTHTVSALMVMPPVPNGSDQRLSFAPDGGVAALAKFEDGSTGVVAVAADGSVSVPVESVSAVSDETGNADPSATFTAFKSPATASAGRLAFLATLRAIAAGQPVPAQAIFSNEDGTLRRVLARGDALPGNSNVRMSTLGQPLMGERGVIGLIAALTGAAPPPTRKAIVRIEDGVKTVVARLGEQAQGYGPGVKFRRFMSMVVTDSDPGRIVFTATVGGLRTNASNNVGLWSYSGESGLRLVMQKGSFVHVGADLTVKVRAFDALQAPKKSMGQGRSTDADGFVTARATLSDGRKGVLRIPLP